MADRSEAKIDFAVTPWDEPHVGVRSKVAVRNGKKLRVVEFTDKFVEHDWCMKGHIGYVLEGDLEIHFPDRVERFTVGDGIMIAGGEEWRHKARVTGSVVRLVLVEDA
jgi:ethanolamine utilization protein EutQ (cupin superfamily)